MSGRAGRPRDALTPRQRLFVVAFCSNGGVANQAAIAAGYSANSAEQQGSVLLRNPKVSAAIVQGRERLARKLEITGAALAEAIARIAFSDARRLFGADGKLLPVHVLDDDTAAAVASIEVRTDAKTGERITKIRLADKNSAQRNLAIALGMVGPGRPSPSLGNAADGARQTEMRSMLRCLSPKQIAAWRDIVETIQAAAKSAGDGAPAMIEHEDHEP